MTQDAEFLMVSGRSLAVMKSRCAGKMRAIWKLINCFQIVELRNKKKLEEKNLKSKYKSSFYVAATIFVTQR